MRISAARVSLGVLLVLLVVAATACGSSDKKSSGSSNPTPSSPPPVTSTRPTAAGGSRLSAADWATYLAMRSKARTVNASATKTFKHCKSLINSHVSTSAIRTCLTNSTQAVVTQGKVVLTDLGKLQPDSGGACAESLRALNGYVKLYVGSVQALGTAAGAGNIPGGSAQIDNSVGALGRARVAQDAVVKTCKPT